MIAGIKEERFKEIFNTLVKDFKQFDNDFQKKLNEKEKYIYYEIYRQMLFKEFTTVTEYIDDNFKPNKETEKLIEELLDRGKQ